MIGYEIGDLILNISKEMKTKSERSVREKKIGIGQLQILVLFYRSEESISQKEVSRQLGVDKGNVSRSIKKLLEHGYIAHENAEEKNVFRLTNKGASIKTDIFEAFRKIYREMFVGITDEEILFLLDTLRKVKENLNQNGDQL